MKNLLKVLCIFITLQNSAFAQCDIANKDFSISPNVISIGQSANMKFTVYNAATNGCNYPAGAIEVVFSLPSKGYDFQSIASPINGEGEYFTWIYDPYEKVVIGVNHKAIPSGMGDADVTIKVIGTSKVKSTSVLNIGVVDGSPNMSIDNDPQLGTLEVSDIAAPLPVRLISFNGKSTNNGNLLNWKTTSEQNFSHYEIEKSDNASTFIQIAKINGSGNSKENLAYEYLDKNSNAGMLPGANTVSQANFDAYYRLKMVDLNGKYDYSKVIFINQELEKSTVGVFYPNPSIGTDATIIINSAISEDWNVSSFDVSGRQLSSEKFALLKGENKLKLNLDKSVSGISIYKFENSEGVQYRKLNR